MIQRKSRSATSFTARYGRLRMNCAAIAHLSNLAAFEEIEANDFNLSVSTYVEQEDKREKIDIVKLNAEIEEIVKRENVLREEIRKIIGEIEG